MNKQPKYTHSAPSLIRSLTLSTTGQASGHRTKYDYDNASRLRTVTDIDNDSATYSYVANSMLPEQILFRQNGTDRMTTTRNYDGLNRLTNVASVVSGSNVAGFGYRYNDAGKRDRVALADGAYWVFGYDDLGQVTSGKKYWSDGSPVAGQQFEYTFDDIGNRLTAGTGGNQAGTGLHFQTNFANGLNQYTNRSVPGYVQMLGTAQTNADISIWGSGGNHTSTSRKGTYFWGELPVANNSAPVLAYLTNIAFASTGPNSEVVDRVMRTNFVPRTPESFLHDLDGNLKEDGRWSYTWDAENRLTKMESLTNAPAGSKRRVEFAYDFLGRRIWKKVTNLDTSAVESETRFLYDGWNLIAELNTVGTAVRRYAWGKDLSGTEQGAGGVGGLLKVYCASLGGHFCAYDGNGNIVGLVKSDGSISAQYEYGPFGEVLRATGPMTKANPFRFSTKYQDDETDLLYYGYRYYNAGAGRWLSRDPLGEQSGLNDYCFVDNSPIVKVDEDGRLAWVYRGATSAKHECGGWSSAWLLTGINTTKPVWLVSKITENYNFKNCSGYGITGTAVSWEAMKITGSFRDLDAMADYRDFYGTQSDTIVTAIFPDKEPYSSEIPEWGHQVPSSGVTMFSTYTQPSWWGKATGTATRSEWSSWNCCCWSFTRHDWNPK